MRPNISSIALSLATALQFCPSTTWASALAACSQPVSYANVSSADFRDSTLGYIPASTSGSPSVRIVKPGPDSSFGTADDVSQTIALPGLTPTQIAVATSSKVFIATSNSQLLSIESGPDAAFGTTDDVQTTVATIQSGPLKISLEGILAISNSMLPGIGNRIVYCDTVRSNSQAGGCGAGNAYDVTLQSSPLVFAGAVGVRAGNSIAATFSGSDFFGTSPGIAVSVDGSPMAVVYPNLPGKPGILDARDGLLLVGLGEATGSLARGTIALSLAVAPSAYYPLISPEISAMTQQLVRSFAIAQTPTSAGLGSAAILNMYFPSTGASEMNLFVSNSLGTAYTQVGGLPANTSFYVNQIGVRTDGKYVLAQTITNTQTSSSAGVVVYECL